MPNLRNGSGPKHVRIRTRLAQSIVVIIILKTKGKMKRKTERFWYNKTIDTARPDMIIQITVNNVIFRKSIIDSDRIHALPFHHRLVTSIYKKKVVTVQKQLMKTRKVLAQ